jgi:hypothetical protein
MATYLNICHTIFSPSRIQKLTRKCHMHTQHTWVFGKTLGFGIDITLSLLSIVLSEQCNQTYTTTTHCLTWWRSLSESVCQVRIETWKCPMRWWSHLKTIKCRPSVSLLLWRLKVHVYVLTLHGQSVCNQVFTMILTW